MNIEQMKYWQNSFQLNSGWKNIFWELTVLYQIYVVKV